MYPEDIQVLERAGTNNSDILVLLANNQCTLEVVFQSRNSATYDSATTLHKTHWHAVVMQPHKTIGIRSVKSW